MERPRKEDVARRLAEAHYRTEPSITEIYTVVCTRPELEAQPNEPIKLLEVNLDTIPSGILPLGFDPVPASGVPFPSIIIEVTPVELARIQNQELALPDGWTLGPPLPRPETTSQSD